MKNRASLDLGLQHEFIGAYSVLNRTSLWLQKAHIPFKETDINVTDVYVMCYMNVHRQGRLRHLQGPVRDENESPLFINS